MISTLRSLALYAFGAWFAVSTIAYLLQAQLNWCDPALVATYVDPDVKNCTCDCWDGRFKVRAELGNCLPVDVALKFLYFVIRDATEDILVTIEGNIGTFTST